MSDYGYIDSQKIEPTTRGLISEMGHLLGGSTSGFYHWVNRPQSATLTRRQAPIARIQHFFEDIDGTHGTCWYRRILADLVTEYSECSPELVRQIVPQLDLVVCQPRPSQVTATADADAAASIPDLLGRDFTADRPERKFFGDNTSICGEDPPSARQSSIAIGGGWSAGSWTTICAPILSTTRSKMLSTQR